MEANRTELAMKAYRLGATACVLVMEKPEGWKRKLAGNVRSAKKLGIIVDPKAFYDVFPPPRK